MIFFLALSILLSKRKFTYLLEVALYLYKSTIHPCIKYCFHVWTGAPSCYLELLDKLQKQYAGLLVLHLLLLLNPWLIVEMWPA